MLGYKAFNKNLVCRDFQYEIGETYELPNGEKPIICERGFHFCKEIEDLTDYYTLYSSRIAVVEALGDIVSDDEGEKYCTNKIHIVKEITEIISEMDQLNKELRNTGIFNKGNKNTGNCNFGNFNTGDHNIGSFNVGLRNKGNSNSGNYNIGSYNTGHRNHGYNNRGNHNTGDDNIGSFNIGNFNVGHYNIGVSNTGDFNAGDNNTGARNIGRYNAGSFNIGNFNTGFFNTKPPTLRIFNVDSGLTFEELADHLDMTCAELKKFFSEICFGDIEKADYDLIKKLPNYNEDLFNEILNKINKEEEKINGRRIRVKN